MHRSLAITVCLLAPGCVVPENTHPGTRIAATVESQHNHRGMPQTERGSFEPEMALTFPTTLGGSIDGFAKGYMDLSNSTGDAWTPDGHAGKFQQIDFVASYAQTFGGFNLRAGVHNYNLPQGSEFQFGARGATNEVFFSASTEVLGANPYAVARYDFDEVDGWYFRGGLRESIPFEGLEVILDGHIAYSDEEQSLWNYGIEEEGLADLKGSVEVKYSFGDQDRYWISGTLSGSTILDSTLEDWFDTINIDKDNIWVGVQVGWGVPPTTGG